MFDIKNLVPNVAKLELKYPISGEPTGVFIKVVGQDSKQFYDAKVIMMKRFVEIQAQKKEIDVVEQEQLLLHALASCVVGWDEEFNVCFKSVDAQGTGAYRHDLVVEMFKNPEFSELRNQIDKFVGDRAHFFVK